MQVTFNPAVTTKYKATETISKNVAKVRDWYEVIEETLINKIFNKSQRKNIENTVFEILERRTKDLNIFEGTEYNETIYKEALQTMENFIRQNIPQNVKNEEQIKNIVRFFRQPVINKIGVRVNEEMEKIKTIGVFPSQALAEEVLSTQLKLDEYERQLQAIIKEARINGQTKLNPQQSTAYNKIVTRYNKYQRSLKKAQHDFYITKYANQAIMESEGMGDFYKPYSYMGFNLNQGPKQVYYNGYIVSLPSKSGNKLIQLKDDPNKQVAFDKNWNILSTRTLENGKRKTVFYDKDGAPFKKSVFDLRTGKSKVTNLAVKKKQA